MPLADWNPPLFRNRESYQGSQCFSVPHGGVPRFAAGTYRPLLFILLSYVGAVGWGKRSARARRADTLHPTAGLSSEIVCGLLRAGYRLPRRCRSSPSTKKIPRTSSRDAGFSLNYLLPRLLRLELRPSRSLCCCYPFTGCCREPAGSTSTTTRSSV